MSVTTDVTTDVTTGIDTTGDSVTAQGRFTIKNLPTLDLDEARKPLFAVVGVADLALEQAKTLPTSVKTLRGEVETRVEQAAGKATELYTQLTVRGERLVTQIRRQPATEAAIAEGKEAVRKAEAAAVAAKKSAQAGETAVEDAAAKLG